MTNKILCKHFLIGKSIKYCNLTSDGSRLFSYNTCIAEKFNNKLYINYTKYSRTTTLHLNLLLKLNDKYDMVYVTNVPINTKNLV